MPWRYQPVFTIDEAGPAYTLVAAIFDKGRDGYQIAKVIRAGIRSGLAQQS